MRRETYGRRPFSTDLSYYPEHVIGLFQSMLSMHCCCVSIVRSQFMRFVRRIYHSVGSFTVTTSHPMAHPSPSETFFLPSYGITNLMLVGIPSALRNRYGSIGTQEDCRFRFVARPDSPASMYWRHRSCICAVSVHPPGRRDDLSSSVVLKCLRNRLDRKPEEI